MSALTFGSVRQIAAMILGSSALLFAVDYVKHPRPLGSFFASGGLHGLDEAGNVTRPEVTVFMSHMCCPLCVVDLEKSLRVLPWVGSVRMNEDRAPAERKLGNDYGGSVAVQITDLRALDFMALDAAIRRSGMTAERLTFRGVTHFRLEATLPHVCCDDCNQGLVDGVAEMQKYRGGGQFSWMDSATVDTAAKKVTVFARYDRSVDVQELIAGLGRLGFAPASVRVLTGDEGS
jgi:hypothetical protein